jgi:7-dehydrocholesterol reductase
MNTMKRPGPLEWAIAGLGPDDAIPPTPVLREVEPNLVRTLLGPLFILTTTPVLAVWLWQLTVPGGGTLAGWSEAVGVAGFFQHIPSPTLTGAAILLGWLALQLGLLLLLPAQEHLGPPTPAGERPRYRENGLGAWIVTHGLLVGGWAAGVVRPAALVEAWGGMLVLLNVSALVLCAALYVKGRTMPSSRDTVYTGLPVFDFFQGIELHPRMFGVSLKQLINCRLSMMGWSAATLLFALAQHDQGHLTGSLAACAAVTVLYLLKFFWWETGYFGSLDIMHDRFGYYIAWGVIAWVPALYCLPGFWMLHHGQDLPLWQTLGWIVFGVACIWINYDADAQRQRVRATDGQTTVWGKAPVLLEARYTTADGQQRTNKLLASGWWGVARHFHYIPELGLAMAWTAPAGFGHLAPWLYWLFLAILLFDRSIRDEKRCAAKYRADWERYVAQVRWRILPGVF